MIQQNINKLRKYETFPTSERIRDTNEAPTARNHGSSKQTINTLRKNRIYCDGPQDDVDRENRLPRRGMGFRKDSLAG